MGPLFKGTDFYRWIFISTLRVNALSIACGITFFTNSYRPMKILAIADIHAKPAKLQLIENSIKKHTPDLLVLAGDVVNYFKPQKTIDKLSALGIPTQYIRGNSDLSSLDRLAAKSANLKSLHLNKLDFGQFNMVGISGALPLPFHSKIRFFEKHHLKQLKKLINPNTILVVHIPPRGTKDKAAGRIFVGSRQLRYLVEEKKPAMVICGHVHEGDHAPDECPSCKHPQSYFEVLAENY